MSGDTHSNPNLVVGGGVILLSASGDPMGLWKPLDEDSWVTWGRSRYDGH